MQNFFDSPVFNWYILPLLIFFARICDMSLDTMRIIMIGHRRKALAALLGFFEVCLWLLVARQVIAHLPNIACFFAYAGGFAAGNYVGMWIEERLSVGAQVIRVIVPSDGKHLVEALKAKGFGVTTFSATGTQGQVNVIYTVVARRDTKTVAEIVETIAPKAFYTIEDVRHVSEGGLGNRSRGLFDTLGAR